MTVPVGCTSVIVCWNFWYNGTATLASCLLDGNSYDEGPIESSSGTTVNGGGMVQFSLPATGSLSFSISWTSTPDSSEGPLVTLIYLQGGSTEASPWRSSATDHANTSSSVQITLDPTSSGADLLLAYQGNYSSAPGALGGAWSTIGTQSYNNEESRYSYMVADAASEVIDGVTFNYSVLTGIAVIQSAGTLYEQVLSESFDVIDGLSSLLFRPQWPNHNSVWPVVIGAEGGH